MKYRLVLLIEVDGGQEKLLEKPLRRNLKVVCL